MENFKNYFSEALNDANESYFSMDAYDYDDDFSFVDDDGYSADGGQGSAPTSQPYIVNVQNTVTTSADIANVTILGAYSQLGQTAPAYGNTAGITITMGIANLTYTEFLYQSMNKPFVVGLTYMTSTNDAQVLETMTLTQKDINGNVSSKVLTPTIDPYQFQGGKIAMKFVYKIDGFTNIVISSVLGSNSSGAGNIKLYFYPSETVSTSRSLSGRRAVRGYGNPKVERTNKLQLSRRAVRQIEG